MFWFIQRSKVFSSTSTDDRKDFVVDVKGNDLIVFKSPTLTIVNLVRKDLKNSLENIAEDLGGNVEELKTDHLNRKRTTKRIKKLTKFIKNVDLREKQNNKINSGSWIKKLIDDQINKEENYYPFGKNFKEYDLIQTPKDKKIRKNPYANVTTQKRKLLPITSNERMKDLPSIYTKIPTDLAKKIEAAKQVFDKIIKQVPSEIYKKFKIDFNEKNNITIDEE